MDTDVNLSNNIDFKSYFPLVNFEKKKKPLHVDLKISVKKKKKVAISIDSIVTGMGALFN